MSTHRDVRASLAVVEGPTDQQLWAAARALALAADRAGAGVEALRDVLGAIGFDPAHPPRGPQMSAAPHARDAQDTRPRLGRASRKSQAAKTASPGHVDQPAEEPTP